MIDEIVHTVTPPSFIKDIMKRASEQCQKSCCGKNILILLDFIHFFESSNKTPFFYQPICLWYVHRYISNAIMGLTDHFMGHLLFTVDIFETKLSIDQRQSDCTVVLAKLILAQKCSLCKDMAKCLMSSFWP